MVRLTGPLDVPYAPVANTRRVVRVAEDQSGQRMAAVGEATSTILNHVRDQQIDNEIARAEMKTRTQLDALRREIQNVPQKEGGAEPDIEGMWRERSAQIIEENQGTITSNRGRSVWRQRADALLQQETQQVSQLVQVRSVERARAGLIETIGQAQTTLVDENATPQARAQAMTVIEATVNRAVQRRVLGADDGARMIEGARSSLAEFEANQGMRARRQQAEDRIWAESGGNLALALEMARDVTEPGLRDALEDSLSVRYNREQAADRDALDDAMGRAYEAIEGGGGVDALSTADRRLITQRGQMDTLRIYARNRTSGPLAQQSQDVRDRLLSFADEPEGARLFAELNVYEPIDDPELAAALDIEPGQAPASVMRREEINAIRQRQRQMRGEEPLTEGTTIAQRAYQMLRNYAEPIAEAQGMDLSERQGRPNADTTTATRRFRGFLHREAAAFVERNRTLPSQRDLEEITTLALTQARTPGGRTRRVFESAGRADVRVRFEQIPEYQVARMIRAARQQGRDIPTNEMALRRLVEDMYQQEITVDE